MTETTGITETTATIAATTATTIAGTDGANVRITRRSEEHTSELQSQSNLVCRLLLEKKKKDTNDSAEGLDNRFAIQDILVSLEKKRRFVESNFCVSIMIEMDINIHALFKASGLYLVE